MQRDWDSWSLAGAASYAVRRERQKQRMRLRVGPDPFERAMLEARPVRVFRRLRPLADMPSDQRDEKAGRPSDLFLDWPYEKAVEPDAEGGERKRGEVRIGIKARRGRKGDKSTTAPGFLNIDVTSGSGNRVGPRKIPAKTLSPLTLGPYTDSSGATAARFENYWQYGKLWPAAGHIQKGTECEPTKEWERFRDRGYAADKGKRRPLPLAKYGRPSCARYLGQPFDWVESRERVYVPGYLSLIRSLPVMRELQKLLEAGQNVMIIDGDGPPKELWPHGMPMTAENWDQMIRDRRYSFGHGYVVAAFLAGLLP